MPFQPKKVITDEQKKFLIDNSETMSIQDLSVELKVSKSKVMQWKTELNLIGKKTKTTIKSKAIDGYYFNWKIAKSNDFIFHNV